MRISHDTVTTALGPGNRYVLWVQGCKKKCKGCINPEGQDLSGGHGVSVEEIEKRIMNRNDIVGVTVSGGEPLLQLDELYELFTWIKDYTNLDIMLYSGYSYQEIIDTFGQKGYDCLMLTDIFVDGEFDINQNNNSIYRGSDNQKFYFFSSKYRELENDFLNSHNREFSFDITEEGDIFFTGIPPTGFYETFLKNLGGQ